jgi:hypothetical protein
VHHHVEGDPETEADESDSGDDGKPAGGDSGKGQGASRHIYPLAIELDAAQLFRILPGLQNLDDQAERFAARLTVEATAGEDGRAAAWLRNAVEEHIEEAGLGPGSVG